MSIERININKSSATSNVIRAAVPNKIIRVLALYLQAASAVNVTIEDGATTDMIGLVAFTANGGCVLPYNPAGWGETAIGQSLNMLLSGAIQVGGCATLEIVELGRR